MAEEPKSNPGSSRWMRILLVASLALNLLIVGLVAGAVLGGRSDGDRGAESRAFQRQPLIGALEPAMRRDVLQQLRRDARQPGEHARALRGRFRAYLDALRSDSFDVSEVGRLLSEQRASMGGWQDAVDGILLEKLSEMTPEERFAYADRLEELGRRGRKRR